MTQRTDPKLSPFITIAHPTACTCCGEPLPVDAVAVEIVRANPSRAGVACPTCWRKACACVFCRVEITPDVEHFMRWLPMKHQFVGVCLACADNGALGPLRALCP